MSRGSTCWAVSLVVSRDIAGLDVIGGLFRRVVERRRLDVIGGFFRRVERCLARVIDLPSCRGSSLCATSSAESFTLCHGTSPGPMAGRGHGVSYVVPRDVAGLDSTVSTAAEFRRVFGRRRARRHRRNLPSCRGTSPGSTSWTELPGSSYRPSVVLLAVAVCDFIDGVSVVLSSGRWARFCQQYSSGAFVVSLDVARRDVIDGISYLVSWGVDGLVFVGRQRRFFVVSGGRRWVRRHRQSLSWCRGMSPCSTSAEFFVVSQDVAGRTSRGLTSSAESLYVMLLVVAVRNFINVFTTESLVIVSWNAAGCMFIGEVFRRVGQREGSTSLTEPFIVPLDVAEHDVIDGISLCRGISGLDIIGKVFRCVARRRRANVAGLDVMGAVSYVMPRVVAVRDVID